MTALAQRWLRARGGRRGGLQGLGSARQPCDVLWDLFDRLAEAMLDADPRGIAKYLSEAKLLIEARPSAGRCEPAFGTDPEIRDVGFVKTYLQECERTLVELSPANTARYGRSLNGLEGLGGLGAIYDDEYDQRGPRTIKQLIRAFEMGYSAYLKTMHQEARARASGDQAKARYWELEKGEAAQGMMDALHTASRRFPSLYQDLFNRIAPEHRAIFVPGSGRLHGLEGLRR